MEADRPKLEGEGAENSTTSMEGLGESVKKERCCDSTRLLVTSTVSSSLCESTEDPLRLGDKLRNRNELWGVGDKNS